MRSTDWYHAAGHVEVGPDAFHVRGGAMTRAGVGHFRFVMDQSVDHEECAVLATIHDINPNVGIAYHEVDDFTFEFHTFTGGAAADHDFAFAILRFAP